MIIACPASRLGSVWRSRRPSHLISLISPDARPSELPGVERLVLRFNDIAEPRPGLIAPDEALIRRLLTFAETWPATAPLVVHCHAGVSRSPAAAYILACARASVGREAELAGVLRARSPEATPNALMVSLADDILGRGGAMRAAIAAIGRGREAFEGPVFSLAG